MCRSAWKIREHFNCLELGAHKGLFIAEDQVSYYNIVTTLNYMPRQ
jgi:hypothetical protein